MAAKPRTSVPPAREAALTALSMTLSPTRAGQGLDAQAALDGALQKRTLSPQDRALCTELFYGYLRLKERLDYILSRHLNKPGGLPPTVRLTLGLAAYEILHLDGVPVWASVNWAVDQTGRHFGKGLSGLANAVLRRIAGKAATFSDPSFYKTGDCPDSVFLSRFYSCPQWLTELWLYAYGRKRCEAYLAAQISPPPHGLRVNLRKPGGKTLFDGLRQTPECLFASSPMLAFAQFPSDFDVRKAEETGAVSRQSAAAGNALDTLDPRDWPSPILDACAGRGGKTLHLAEQTRADVFASDMHFGRLRALGAEARRLGLEPIPRFRASAAGPPLGTGSKRPRTILLDAPCSGLGVLSRRPDAKYKRQPADLAALAALQRAMLDACHQALPSGGLLVYLTCTLNPAENEEQIASFLERTPGATLEMTLDQDATACLSEFFYGARIRKA